MRLNLRSLLINAEEYRAGRKFRGVFNFAFFVGGSSHENYTWKVELIPAKFSK